MEKDTFGVSEFFDNSGNLPASQASIKGLINEAFAHANTAYEYDARNRSLLLNRDSTDSSGQPAPMEATLYLHSQEQDGLVFEVEVSTDYSDNSPLFKKTTYSVYVDSDGGYSISKNIRYPNSDIASQGLRALLSEDIEARREAEEMQDEQLEAEEESRMLQEQLGMDIVSEADIAELIYIFKSPDRLPPRPPAA